MTARSLLLISNNEKNQLIAATISAILIAIPICLMVPLYQDDFERAINGQYYWSGDGRPIAELIYRLISFGSPQVVLTSPLGMLLCIPGISFSSLLLCRIFDHRKIWGGALAAILLFSSPYFIENLSFSFDSPMMVLAVFFSLCAAYLIVSFCSKWASFAAVFLAVCSLSLYQAANSAVWIPVLLFCLFRIPLSDKPAEIGAYQQESSASNLIRRTNIQIIRSLFFCLFFALLIYKFFVLPNSGLLDYALEHGSTPSFFMLPITIIGNVGLFVNDVLKDWDGKFGLAFGGFLIISIFAASLDSQLINRSLDKNKSRSGPILVILFRFIAALSILAFSYGLALILEEPVFDPRAFTGIGVYMASIALLATRYTNLNDSQFIYAPTLRFGKDLLVVVSSFAAAWACVYILFAYANAYASQQNLNDYYLGSIAQEVRQKGYGPYDIDKLAIKGKSPRSPVALNTFRTLPVLKNHGRIAPLSWYWPNLKLMSYGFNQITMTDFNNVNEQNLISSDPVYNLYVDDNTLFVRFNKRKKPQ